MNGRAFGGALALVLAASVWLPAHHNANAEYNSEAPVTLSGTITRIEWTNPHSFLELERKTPDGQPEKWRIEAAGPAALAKEQISRETLAVGTVVTINGWRAKNGTLRAWGVDVTLPNGATRKLTDSMLQAVDEELGPPSALARLTSSLPFLPYLVGALPVIVLVAGVIILRRRRRPTRSVPQ